MKTRIVNSVSVYVCVNQPVKTSQKQTINTWSNVIDTREAKPHLTQYYFYQLKMATTCIFTCEQPTKLLVTIISKTESKCSLNNLIYEISFKILKYVITI